MSSKSGRRYKTMYQRKTSTYVTQHEKMEEEQSPSQLLAHSAHRICSKDEEKLLRDEKDSDLSWEFPRAYGIKSSLKRVNENNFRVSDLDSRARRFKSNPTMERRVYLITPERQMVNNSAPSSRAARPKVSGEENRDQKELRYKEQSRGWNTTSIEFLREDHGKTGFVHKRDFRGERIEDSMCNPHVEQARQRPVKNGIDQVRYCNKTERDGLHFAGPHSSSSATNQKSQRNIQNYPVTGANAIQLPFPQPKRHTPVRTLQQTNSILLQLAGYTRHEKN